MRPDAEHVEWCDECEEVHESPPCDSYIYDYDFYNED